MLKVRCNLRRKFETLTIYREGFLIEVVAGVKATSAQAVKFYLDIDNDAFYQLRRESQRKESV